MHFPKSLNKPKLSKHVKANNKKRKEVIQVFLNWGETMISAHKKKLKTSCQSQLNKFYIKPLNIIFTNTTTVHQTNVSFQYS